MINLLSKPNLNLSKPYTEQITEQIQLSEFYWELETAFEASTPKDIEIKKSWIISQENTRICSLLEIEGGSKILLNFWELEKKLVLKPLKKISKEPIINLFSYSNCKFLIVFKSEIKIVDLNSSEIEDFNKDFIQRFIDPLENIESEDVILDASFNNEILLLHTRKNLFIFKEDFSFEKIDIEKNVLHKISKFELWNSKIYFTIFGSNKVQYMNLNGEKEKDFLVLDEDFSINFFKFFISDSKKIIIEEIVKEDTNISEKNTMSFLIQYNVNQFKIYKENSKIEEKEEEKEGDKKMNEESANIAINMENAENKSNFVLESEFESTQNFLSFSNYFSSKNNFINFFEFSGAGSSKFYIWSLPSSLNSKTNPDCPISPIWKKLLAHDRAITITPNFQIFSIQKNLKITKRIFSDETKLRFQPLTFISNFSKSAQKKFNSAGPIKNLSLASFPGEKVIILKHEKFFVLLKGNGLVYKVLKILNSEDENQNFCTIKNTSELLIRTKRKNINYPFMLYKFPKGTNKRASIQLENSPCPILDYLKEEIRLSLEQNFFCEYIPAQRVYILATGGLVLALRRNEKEKAKEIIFELVGYKICQKNVTHLEYKQGLLFVAEEFFSIFALELSW